MMIDAILNPRKTITDKVCLEHAGEHIEVIERFGFADTKGITLRFADGKEHSVLGAELIVDTIAPQNEYEVTEVCSHCESEITIIWNVKTMGYKAFCPVCGKRLMLCDECLHAEDGRGVCDYDSQIDSCYRNPEDEAPANEDNNQSKFEFCPFQGDCYHCTNGAFSQFCDGLCVPTNCPLGGDIENDCADCVYAGEYHFVDGQCVLREEVGVNMTYKEMRSCFRAAEQNKQHITGYIVFSPSSFEKEYSLESRTYVVSSDNKAFKPNMGGYSIFAQALDGSDKGVRLDWYMAEEKGGVKGWQVENCYMSQEDYKLAQSFMPQGQ